MMRLVFMSLLLTGLAVAQGSSSSPAPVAPKATGSASNTAVVSKSNPAVITINGLCNSPGTGSAATNGTAHKSPKADCKTVITRSQFEQLADALPVPAASRKQFANWYATALIMANEAHKRGLDHGPRYEELLKVTRLQVLAQQLSHTVQEESQNVSEQEIANYYHNNSVAYEEATLERLYIPRTQQQDSPKDAKESEADAQKRQQDSEAAMKKEADDLRARAAVGEDFKTLQAEAYKFANFKASTPEVKMEKARRTALPPAQAVVFEMTPGTVSAVIPDSAGFFIYKMESKDTLPLDRVHDEIRAALQKQHMQDAAETMKQSATPVFDDAYFSSITPAPPAQQMGPRGGAPGQVPMPAPPHAPANPSAQPK